MVGLQLVDTIFSHEVCTVPQKISNKIQWIRTDLQPDKPTVFSHEYMFATDLEKFSNRYGLIFESQSVIPDMYNHLESVIDKFNIVFTHSSKLLEKYPNTRWIPGGGVWIGGSVNQNTLGGSGGQIMMYNKNKFCSLVSSDKKMSSLHRFRHLSAEMLKYSGFNIDVFTSNTTGWVPAIDALKDYYYSIVIENFVDDRYFTEKLLNCLAVGTIPIYLGARDLSKDFDERGIIRIDSIDSLINTLETLSTNDYMSRYNSVINNFLKVQNYIMIEDYIADNYLHEINGY